MSVSEDIRESKKQLRKLLKAEALAHGVEQREKESQRLETLLEANEHFLKAGGVLLYHALKDEINLNGLIFKWAKNKRIFLPRVSGEDLEIVPVKGEQDLKAGAFGILEPQGEAISDLGLIDLIVVPGMAFDLGLRRLGRGKGFYDRLLKIMPEAFRIGVCHSWQIVPGVPHEPHDILMNEVLFP